MSYFLLAIVAYVMGFLTAIPPGATQIEIAKRAFDQKSRAAYMVVLGSVLSDTAYGAVALFGLAPFFRYTAVQLSFWLAGTAVLAVLAVITFKRISETDGTRLDNTTETTGKLSVSFVTGYSLAVTNPMMIFWWLAGSRIIVDIHIVSKFNVGHSIVFLFAGAAGIGSYLVTLSSILKKARRFLSETWMHRIKLGMAVALVVLGLYFLFRSIMILL